VPVGKSGGLGNAGYAVAPGRLVRFEGLLQIQSDRNLRLAEICAALGVSDRTLRSLYAEHLGMSPTSYLRLRWMSLIYRALGRLPKSIRRPRSPWGISRFLSGAMEPRMLRS